MNGRQAKKIRQQYSREFRAEVKKEARKLVEEQRGEIDGAVDRFKKSLFKPRPKWVPRRIWLWVMGLTANMLEVEINGLIDDKV